MIEAIHNTLGLIGCNGEYRDNGFLKLSFDSKVFMTEFGECNGKFYWTTEELARKEISENGFNPDEFEYKPVL